MGNKVAAGDEHKECCKVVGNKEVFSRDKDQVVEEINGEVANAEVEHKVLEVGIR